MVRRKPHRLPEERYIGKICVAFTAAERLRRPLLATPEVFELTQIAIKVACQKQSCKAPIFTLMPDHAHFLMIGDEDTSDLLAAMDYVKWRTGAQFRAKKMSVRWQESYYDEITRLGEEWATQARYIAINPIRAGLVEELEDWPYTGSVGYDLNLVLSDAFNA